MNAFFKEPIRRTPTPADLEIIDANMTTPQLLSIVRAEDGESHSIEIYSRGTVSTLEAPAIDRRRELSKVFSEDVVDIILGEKKISGDRTVTLAEIRQQFRAYRSQLVGASAIQSSNDSL